MNEGRGSVYRQKYKDGTQGSIWWIQWYRDGKRYRESSESKTKGVAKKLLNSRIGDVSRGLPVLPGHGRLTFNEAAKDIVNDYRANGKRSIDGVERRLKKHLAPVFGDERMVRITTADIRAYIVKRQEDVIVTKAKKDGAESSRPVSNGEINRELSILKRVFNLAVQGGKLLHRPYVPMLKENNVRSGFFEPEQFAAVLSRLPEPLQPVIEFAYITGWRIQSEVLAIQWRQVDFSKGEVRLDAGTTKNGDGRVFPMSARLRALLLDQQQRTETFRREKGRICPWVFHRDGDQIKSFKKAFATACRLAGCPGRIPHDLRRTAVRSMVHAGIPERVAMMMTGHKTRSVFERYNIVSNSDLHDAARKLEKAIGPAIADAMTGRS